MFKFLTGIPGRLKNILSHFKKHLTKPQYNNFCRTELALISAAKKEHDITSLNELYIDQKNQSTLNRFFTNPKWTTKNPLQQTKHSSYKKPPNNNKHPNSHQTQNTDQ
jgi:hypothetical protein